LTCNIIDQDAVDAYSGHRQAAYAMQYARSTTAELSRVLDER
jgi:hypothetical protein